MIYGIGTDIVEIARMQAALDRHGERFGRKLLHAGEWPEFQASSHPARLLAKRFAAKEALSKAVGTGLRAPLTLTHLAVVHDGLGKPRFEFSPSVTAWLALRGIGGIHLSLSDEQSFVIAFVVLETSMDKSQS